jgi:hypothetical protein
MNRHHRLNVLLALAILTASSLLSRAADNLAINSHDGLSLQVTEAGMITTILLDGKTLPGAEIPGGLSVRDVIQNGEFLPVSGKAESTKDGIAFKGKIEPLKLEMETMLQARGDYIAVEGVVRNRSGADRCVDVKFHLPVDCKDWQWGSDLAGEALIHDKIEGRKNSSNQVTVYPFAPVSSSRLGAGISLAVPPTQVTLFNTGADKHGLYITFKIGISDATSPANETSFKLIVYRHDPKWGFRSSIQRYYEFFHEPFFTRRVKRIGAWSWHEPSTSKLPNPQLYAFHEAGDEQWKATPGEKHEGYSTANSVADYEKMCEFATDEKLGIYSLPYTIVGQRQIYRLPAMPKTRDEALEALDKWTTDKPLLFQSCGPADSFRNVEQLKAIIRNSGLYDEEQKPTVLIRDYLGNTVSFPLNPNPRLYSDSNKITIAKYTLDDYLPMLFEGSKLIDGCYLDSLGRWLNYYNYRREHFKYSTVPLTYSGKAPQASLWNAQSHAEYLWELSRRFRAQDKILFANGVHADRVMLGFAVDAMGMEGTPSYLKHDAFYSARVAAYTKPYCALNAGDNASPTTWNSCLYLGILIGSHSGKALAMERKFLPTIIRLNEAGWEPITHALTDSTAVGIERWGSGREVLFSLMNRSKKPVQTSVRVDRRALHLGGTPEIVDLLSKKSITASASENELVFKVTLEPEQATAFSVASITKSSTVK